MLSVLTFRTPDEAIEKANNTPYGLSAGVWTEKGSRILSMAARLRAGVVWANTFNRFDPTAPFGGYKESGFGREGGRHGLEAYLDATESTLSRAQDVQALSRRRVPALGVGTLVPGVVGEGRAAGARRAGVPQGRARRGRRRSQGVRRLVGRDRLQPRPGALPRGRDARGTARAVRRRGRGRRRRRGRRRPSRRSTPRSTAGSTTPAGPTSTRRSPAAPTRSPGSYFTFSLPEPTGVVGVLAPQDSSLLGLVSVLAPVLTTGQHRRGASRPRPARCPPCRSPRCWRPRTSRAAWSTC